MDDGRIMQQLERRGYIAIMPHWHSRRMGEHWMDDQMQLIEEVKRIWPKARTDKLYMTGISMGGGGTYRLAAAHPDRFAAIACVSGVGGGPPEG